jgi:hypothetical protein
VVRTIREVALILALMFFLAIGLVLVALVYAAVTIPSTP